MPEIGEVILHQVNDDEARMIEAITTTFNMMLENTQDKLGKTGPWLFAFALQTSAAQIYSQSFATKEQFMEGCVTAWESALKEEAEHNKGRLNG